MVSSLEPSPGLYKPWLAREKYGESATAYRPWEDLTEDLEADDESDSAERLGLRSVYRPWEVVETAEDVDTNIQIFHDWHNLVGVEMTPDAIHQMEPDLLRRDDFSLWEREQAWGEAEEVHQASRESGSPSTTVSL